MCHVQDGYTPLHLAATHNSSEAVVQALLAAYPEAAMATNNDGLTPLHGAAFKGNSGAVSALLDHGANIDAVDDGGATPLSLACSPGVVALLRARTARGGAPAVAARRF